MAMKRFWILGGAMVVTALLCYTTPLTAAPLMPYWPDNFIDWSGGIVPAVQLVVSAAIVAGFIFFDLFSHNLGRTSILIGIGTEIGVRVRAFVRRTLDPLSEVQRSRQGSVALSRV